MMKKIVLSNFQRAFMELAKVISQISRKIENPFFELPGIESQRKLSPVGREQLITTSKIDYTPSGVMVFLYPDEENMAHFILFERVARGAHAGQVGLPGGKFEQQDVNIIQTAVRETKEEIGVEVDSEKLLGRLTPLKIPVSGFEMFPIIGYSENIPAFKKEESEVVQLIAVKVQDLLEAEVLESSFQASGNFRLTAPYFLLNDHKVWGATAMVLSEFRDMLLD